MTTTSANINDLETFVSGSDTAHSARTSEYDTVRAKFQSVKSNSPAGQHDGYFVPEDSPGLDAVEELMTRWEETQTFVDTVRDELVAADNIALDGQATASNTDIETALENAGVAESPDPYEVGEIELIGAPPNSGFVDDPICLANGNFFAPDTDLELPGIAGLMSVVRNYNSRMHQRPGVFGPGWSSLADVSLSFTPSDATFTGPDGGGGSFAIREDGTFAENPRRRLTLVAVDEGWIVTSPEADWLFDRDGTLTGIKDRVADISVVRAPDSIQFSDRTTDRWVTYTVDPTSGLVRRVSTSDGRTAAYRYDTRGSLIAVTRPRGDLVLETDDAGFLASATDADGVVIFRNVYDRDGRVLSQVESHGRETYYDYKTNGVATVTANDDAPPNVMVHDQRGRITAMIDGSGNTMRLAYDDLDNVTQVVDRTGALTRYVRDDRGNITEHVHPDGLAERFAWDEQDRLVAHTDRAGHITRYVYEGDQQSASVVIQPDGVEVHTTYNELERPVSVRDADGVTARFGWNRDGLLETIVDGLGNRTEVEYNAAGRSTRVISPESVAVSLGLDHAGRIRTVRTAEGERSYEYSSAGRLVGGAELNGNRWRAALDTAGDVHQISDTAGGLVTYERDLTGQTTAMITADGGRLGFEYDPTGRIAAKVDAEGHRVAFGFDPEGRMTHRTDPSGRTRSSELDELGRRTMEVLPGGGTVLRSYHPNGELASISDAEGNEWAYEVDAIGRVVSSTDPLGNTTTYRYTPAGRLAEIRSPMGRTIRRSYDGAGRLSRLVEPDGTEVAFHRLGDGRVARTTRDGVETTFDYDETGRQSAIAGPWGEIAAEHDVGATTAFGRGGDAAARFHYDARGLLERVADPAGVVTEFTRDVRGHVIRHATGEATMTFGYDAAGRPAEVVDAYGNRTTVSRDARGVVERLTFADGSGPSYEFGLDGFVAAVRATDGVLLSELRRDLNGMVTTASGGGVDTHIQRDATGRVRRFESDAGAVDYTWDADGYLTAIGDDTGFQVTLESDDSVNVSAFVLADGSRIEAPPALEVTRDRAGRVVTDEHGRGYRYDIAGRLAETIVGDDSTTYRYNDLGLLATEHTASGTRSYRYGVAGELTEYRDASGERSLDYDAAGRRVRERRADGATTEYGWDDLGRLTTVVRTDVDGTQSRDQIRYDPFGRPIDINGTPILWDAGVTGRLLGIGEQRFLWSGSHVRIVGDADSSWDRRITDDPWGDDGRSGVRLGYRGELAVDNLLLLGDRVYDTHTRSFLSRDPLPSRVGAVAFAGVYSYAWCDPVNFVDPSGRRPLSDEEFAQHIEDSKSGWLSQDTWKKIGVAVVGTAALVIATAVAPGIGTAIVAGALIGGASGAANAWIDGEDGWGIARGAAIGAFFGGATGGIGARIPASQLTSFGPRLMQNTGRQAMANYPMAYGQEAANYFVPGGPDDKRFDWLGATINGTLGTAGGVAGAEYEFRTSGTPSTNDVLPDTVETNNLDVAPDALPAAPEPPALPAAPEPLMLEPGPSANPDLLREQLVGVNGIGDNSVNGMMDWITENGMPADLTDIPGVGDKLAGRIREAGII